MLNHVIYVKLYSRILVHFLNISIATMQVFELQILQDPRILHEFEFHRNFLDRFQYHVSDIKDMLISDLIQYIIGYLCLKSRSYNRK